MSKQITKRSKAANQVAKPEVENQVAKPEVENQVAEPEVENQVAKPEVENQVTKLEVGNQVAKPEVGNQVAEPEVENQVAEREVENQVAKPEVENQVAEPEVEDQVAEPEVENQVAEPEVENQVSQPEVENFVDVLDLVWDGWLSSVKLVQAYQRETEDMVFKAIERQKDIWLQSRENLEKAENEINKFADDAKIYFFENIKSLNGGSKSKNVEEWNEQVEEITDHLQQLFGTPGIATSNLVGQSLEQMESILKTMIQHQQKSQNELQTLLENFIDQVKASNKVIKDTWETSNSSAFNMFK